MAKFVQGLWRKFRPAASRAGRRVRAPRRASAPRLVEPLEDRVLLTADVRAFMAPPTFGGLGTLQGVPAVEIGAAAAVEMKPLEPGKLPPISLALVARHANTAVVAPAFGPQSVATSSLMVQDGAGNSLASWSEIEPDDVFKTTAGTIFEPQSPPGTPPEGYGPRPEVGPPSPDELAGLPRMPWSSSYSYTGSIDGQNSTAIRIPVGPFTRTLTLGLKPGAEGEPYMPRIDQVFLLGRGGEMMSRIVGVSILGDGDGDSQTLVISIRGAPAGGEIVVRLVSTTASTPAQPDGQGSGGPGVGGGSVGSEGDAPAADGSYFELSIRRNDYGSQSAGPSASTLAAGGSPYVVAIGRADVPTAIGPLAPAAEATTTSQEDGPAPRTAVATSAASPDLDVEFADEGPVEVFLGPLVSRTAAAVGPALATTSEDPTPSTDRGAGSQADGLAAFGSPQELDAILAVRERRATDAPSFAGPALATLRGPGGVPIVVAGLGVGEEASEAEGLAASVRGAAQDAGPSLADSLDEGPEPEPREVVHAGLATRALSFLIGMGLASGPLYPDLVALARRKFRKLRRKPRRAGGGRPARA